MERLFVKNIFMLTATHFCSLSTAHVNVLCCREVVHFHLHFPRMCWGKYTTKNTLMCDSWKCPYSRNFTAMEMCLPLLQGLVSFSVCWFTRILFLVMCLFRFGGWKIGDGIPGNVFLKSLFPLHKLLITSKRDFSIRQCATLAYMFCETFLLAP